jgi:signal transduction histidine kinase
MRSLRHRLIVTALVWIAIAVPSGGIALAYAFREVVSANFDERLTTTLLLLIGSTERTGEGTVVVTRPLTDPRFHQVYSGWYWIVAQGDQRLHSRSAWDLPLEPQPAAVSGMPRLRTTHDSLGHELRIAEQTVTMAGIAAPVTFAVAGDLGSLRDETRNFNRLLWSSLLALAAGLVLAIVTQVTIGLRPLRRVADDVESVRAGRKSSLDAVGLQEIDTLVAQVNTLIEQDRRLVARARANAADLAHALKTPLALLRTSFDDEHDERLQHVRAIQRTLEWQLARAASTGPRQGVVTELKAVAEALGAGMRKLHAARGLEITIDVADHIRFAGDAEDLEEMLGNLLDNACKWARSRVRLTAARLDDRIAIDVADDGSGMTEAQAASASERGQRFDETIEGQGLGLAIVRDLAALYGGTLQIGSATLGGTKASLQLPAAP